MPIYEYQCSACGHEEEFLQKVTDAPMKKCPACGKNKLHKLVSSSAFSLKGEGWYVTDFKNKGKKEDKKPETKAENKPAESKATKDDK